MNFVFLSPHFPPNYYQFCVNLKKFGVNVLGLSDEPYAELREELRNSLTEYYKVDDMHNYDQLLRALGYFTHKYGKIDRLDSHNEYWLESEAKLRTDFNITGITTGQIADIKRKSKMKKVFEKAGVPVARGRVIKNIREALNLIDEVGYPVVAKPDNGVGAANTFKIKDKEELERFFNVKPDLEFIMEEFLDGDICSFDGLTDRNGKLVFYTGHQYQKGVMEAVNEDTHIYYYSFRDIPMDLEEAGLRILKAFNVRERFFHFEFFRLKKSGKLVPLEVNIRPPGGLTTDMINFACDIDIYKGWAGIIAENKFGEPYTRKYHCCYIGRKFNKSYVHSHDEIMHNYQGILVHHERINSIFGAAMGDYGYLVRSQQMDEIFNAVEFIHKMV